MSEYRDSWMVCSDPICGYVFKAQNYTTISIIKTGQGVATLLNAVTLRLLFLFYIIIF